MGNDRLACNQMSPVFDWTSRHDPRSRDYSIRAALPEQVKRKRKLWFVPRPVIDQGKEGACVGFGWTNELRGDPAQVTFKDPVATALDIYRQAQFVDEFEGNNYSGTSVLAGAKTVQTMGYISNYRWAFGIDDVIDALCTTGPVVLGIPWYNSMYWPSKSGMISVTGDIVGGHCILATGYHPAKRFLAEGWKNTFEVIRLRNSWGPYYGDKGDCWIRIEDLDLLLKGTGEACVPIGRKRP